MINSVFDNLKYGDEIGNIFIIQDIIFSDIIMNNTQFLRLNGSIQMVLKNSSVEFHNNSFETFESKRGIIFDF